MSKQAREDEVALAVDCFDAQYRERGMQSQRSYPNEALIQFIASKFFRLSQVRRRDIRVLEVGCGTGANLWMMAKEGLQVHGLDSSATALELARVHLEDKWRVTAELRQGSFTELPYPDEYFDAIVDVVSLQHLALKGDQLALSEIARVLRPGGEFFSYRLSDRSVMFSGSVAATRIDSATLRNIDDPSMPLANNGPTGFWSSALANMMYAASGLEVLTTERIGRSYANGAYVEYLSLVGKRADEGDER
jgi:ubiquinone/menaquinone biosynthesis C-methylase UbiE